MSVRALAGRIGLAALVGLSGSCNSNEPAPPAPAPLAAAVARPPAPPKPRPAPAPPVNPLATALAPSKVVPWKAPTGGPTRAETPLVGTWVATVGNFATRTEFMADKMTRPVMTAGAMAAAQKDALVKTHCVWLELNKDHKGVRRECGLVGGKPTLLEASNPITGEKTKTETAFEWYYDAPAKAVQIRYAADLFVPMPDAQNRATRLLRFRHWTLTIGASGATGMDIQESMPEHEYTLPAHYVYEVFSGRFQGDKPPADKPK